VRTGIVFLVIAVEDSTREIAIVVPAYYDTDDSQTQDMLEAAVRNGEMRTHVRDLGEERVSTFAHDDPDLFTPSDEE